MAIRRVAIVGLIARRPRPPERESRAGEVPLRPIPGQIIPGVFDGVSHDVADDSQNSM
jgi:hypothetical protein